MSSQFYHVNAYGRHAGKNKEGGHTLFSIIDEAERVHGNCPHVDNPQPAQLLFGMTPREAAEAAILWADNSLDSRGHKLRKDARCLLAGVVSVPDGFNPNLWDRYKDQTICYLQDKYGIRLKSVIEHTDERFRHIHFYVVPNQGERFEDVHEGIKAQNAANPDRGKKDHNKHQVEKQIDRKLGNYAYATAMRKVQDDFWTKVSSRFGLSRIGPKRRRLTRKEIREQKQRENEIAQAYAQVEKLTNELSANYSVEKDRLKREQEQSLQKMQDDYLEQQKGLIALQEKAQEEIANTKTERSTLQAAKRETKELMDKVIQEKKKVEKGRELLSTKLISFEYDGSNVPKPKFLEPAQKYAERVYDDLKWIANRYKEQALKKLPQISHLEDSLELAKTENLKKDIMIQTLQKQLKGFQNCSPEDLIRLARERQREIEDIDRQKNATLVSGGKHR